MVDDYEVTELDETESVSETTEVSDRPFLSTPLDDYTVTEGLLLVIALVLIFKCVCGLVRRII